MHIDSLSIENLKLGFGDQLLISEAHATMQKGKLYALLGENGSGKSTLMDTILGLQHPLSGNILYGSTLVDEISNADKAKQIAYVSTRQVVPYEMNVFELVASGRYPYTSWFGKLEEKDRKVVEEALELTGTSAFQHRTVESLSDGERQKVFIARAIAQQTPFIVLDEPASFLDFNNKVELMKLLLVLVRKLNKGVLFSSHDLDLALSAADTAWVIHDTKLTVGSPEQLILTGFFQHFFENKSICFDGDTGRFEYEISAVQSYKTTVELITEDEVLNYWTKRALRKSGIGVEENSPHKVYISKSDDDISWKAEGSEMKSVEELIEFLLVR